MGRSKKSDSAATLLSPVGDLNVTRAGEFRQELQQALARAEEVTVDLSGVSAVDVTFFQLACAAHRSAVSQKKKLVFANAGIPEAVQRLSAEAGFARHIGCALGEGRGCLWFEEEC